MIYFDNSSTSFPKPPEVALAVAQAINSLGSPYRGFGEPSLSAARKLYEIREDISRLFALNNAQNVAFTSNATAGLNAVISGIIRRNWHVITTVVEHNSVLRPLYKSEAELTLINCDSDGNLCYDEFKKSIKPGTKAVICTHASNLTGNVTDIKFIGKLCREHGLMFILDAAQTAGCIDIDMEENGIDILVFTGHKALFGPQGTGGICVDTIKNFSVKPLIVGGSGYNSYSKDHPGDMPSCFEAGTLNIHSLAGLKAGLDYIQKVGMSEILCRAKDNAMRFYTGVKNIYGIKLYGDYGADIRCPIVTLNIGDIESDYVSELLFSRYEISTRSGAHCAPLMHKALKTEKQGSVRFSFSHFNTENEIDAAIKAIDEISKM